MAFLKHSRPIKEDSFLIPLYPELARFREDLDRGSAMRAVKDRLFHSGRYLALSCFLVALAIPCYSYLHDYIAYLQLPLVYKSCLSIVAVSPILIAFMAPLLILRSSVCLYLREELRRYGIPICLICGYDLTGCRSLICPECGIEFEP